MDFQHTVVSESIPLITTWQTLQDDSGQEFCSGWKMKIPEIRLMVNNINYQRSGLVAYCMLL